MHSIGPRQSSSRELTYDILAILLRSIRPLCRMAY